MLVTPKAGVFGGYARLGQASRSTPMSLTDRLTRNEATGALRSSRPVWAGMAGHGRRREEDSSSPGGAATQETGPCTVRGLVQDPELSTNSLFGVIG